MYQIAIFADTHGKEEITEFLTALQKQASTNKHARVRLQKIQDYIQALSQYGTRIGMPYIKHIESEIWELRPTKDRIFFFCYAGNTFILLHHFEKKTQQTPKRELEQAKRNYKTYLAKENIHDK